VVFEPGEREFHCCAKAGSVFDEVLGNALSRSLRRGNRACKCSDGEVR
jgi:hypothetical protein